MRQPSRFDLVWPVAGTDDFYAMRTRFSCFAPNPAARRIVEQMVDCTRERGLDLAVVTNGYHLLSYLDVLAHAQIREIQVTLDGPPVMHDRRRGCTRVISSHAAKALPSSRCSG